MFSWITNKISISDSQLQLEGSNHFVFSSIDKPHNFFVVHDMDLNYDLSFEMNCFKTIKLVFTTIYIIYFDYYYDYENYSKIFSILFQKNFHKIENSKVSVINYFFKLYSDKINNFNLNYKNLLQIHLDHYSDRIE